MARECRRSLPTLPHVLAAVDGDVGAGDEGGLLGGQMDDQADRLLGLAELMTVAPRSGAASLAKVLPNLPTAVRVAATMT